MIDELISRKEPLPVVRARKQIRILRKIAVELLSTKADSGNIVSPRTDGIGDRIEDLVNFVSDCLRASG